MLTLAKTLRIAKMRLIALDETHYCDLSSCPHGDWVAFIQTLYLYDANEVTNCCSFERNYCFYTIGTRAVFKEGFYDHPEREKIEEAVDNWLGQDGCNDVRYYSVRYIDDLFERLSREPFRTYAWEDCPVTDEIDGDDPEQKYQTFIDAMIEGIHANAVI